MAIFNPDKKPRFNARLNEDGYKYSQHSTRKVKIDPDGDASGRFRVLTPSYHELAKMFVELLPIVSTVEHLQYPEVELRLLKRRLTELAASIGDFRDEIIHKVNQYSVVDPRKLRIMKEKGVKLPPEALRYARLNDYNNKSESVQNSGQSDNVDESGDRLDDTQALENELGV